MASGLLTSRQMWGGVAATFGLAIAGGEAGFDWLEQVLEGNVGGRLTLARTVAAEPLTTYRARARIHASGPVLFTVGAAWLFRPLFGHDH